MRVERDEFARRRVPEQRVVDREPRRSAGRHGGTRRPHRFARRAIERSETHALAIAHHDHDRATADERRPFDSAQRPRAHVQIAALIRPGKGSGELHGRPRTRRSRRAAFGAGRTTGDRNTTSCAACGVPQKRRRSRTRHTMAPLCTSSAATAPCSPPLYNTTISRGASAAARSRCPTACASALRPSGDRRRRGDAHPPSRRGASAAQARPRRRPRTVRRARAELRADARVARFGDR